MAKLRAAFAFAPMAVSDLFNAADLDRLATLCDLADTTPRRDDLGDLGAIDVLITGWGCPRLDSTALDAAPNLRMIAHAAGSIKGIIDADFFARGIAITNAADANAIPVAEFTLAAILFANKNVFRFRRDYTRLRGPMDLGQFYAGKAGNWRRSVGIIGASRIGRRVIDMLKRHDLDIVLADPFVTPADAAQLGVRLATLPELMASCDTVSLHAPLLPETRGMISAELLALLPKDATFINTARGAIVDQDALERELVSGRIAAILDVTEPDVLPIDSRLYTLDNVLLTPHVAGALGRERERFGTLIVDEIGRFAAGQPLHHAVTAATYPLQA